MRSSRFPAFLVVLACLGCDAEERGALTIAEVSIDTPGQTDDTDRFADTDPPDPGCANPLVRIDPADGTEAVALGETIQAVFAGPASGASLRLRSEGRDVQGRVVAEEDGAVVRFEPLVPIRADADYELAVSWSCGVQRATWHTDAVTFRAVPAEATLTIPDTELGIATVLTPLLMRLEALGSGTVQLLVGPAAGFSQDPCAPTAILLGDLDAQGQFDVDAPQITLRAGTSRTTARNVRAVGSLGVGGGALEALSMTATLDLRPLVRALVGSNGTLSDVCGELPAGCARCLDGEIGCVDVRLEALGVAASGATVTPRTPAMISQDPACDAP